MVFSIIEAPFFDLLKNGSVNENKINKIKELIHVIMPILKETAAIKNFWSDKASERKGIEGLIEDEIYSSRIQALSEKAAELTTEL